ncbi:MAG: EamA family transporter [Anaerolineales bacterium]|nr:EamA family transporter [Anaerolineales bacterium]
MWAILALGAALLTSFNPILYKRMLKDTDVLVVIWGVILLALPILGLFTFTFTPQLPRLDTWFFVGVLGSAILNTTAHLANTKALKLADVSLVTPLLTFNPVFTLIISAIFLAEIPTASGVVGVGFVLVGAYWINHSPGAGWLAPFKSLVLNPAQSLVLTAGVLWAVTPLFEKIAILNTDPTNPRMVAFSVNLVLVMMLTPTVLAHGRTAIGKLLLHRREWIIAGLIAGSAPVLGYTAFSLGLIGYVTTLFKFSVLLTVLWGFIFLKEGGISQRLPGAILMLIGSILMVT